MIDNFKNYLLNKSNQYRYYKSEYERLNQDIVKLKNVLKDLNIKIDEKIFINEKLNQNITNLQQLMKLEKDIDILNYNSGMFPPGHFHSPINDLEFLKSREDKIWKLELIESIEFNEEKQLELFKSFIEYYPEIPFKPTKQSDLRYYFENDYYGYGDGTILYSMIRKLTPNRIIEVGSGFSSALMMDMNNHFFENKLKLTFIEPYPERLNSLMSKNDKINNEFIVKIVQDVDLEVFQELESNDILFIDSSHVVKTGSDLQYILFEILPILKNGVYIHFHDIFYPFEYPKEFILDNRYSWNEDYFLRAFLMYNNQFKIILFPGYLYYKHPKILDYMPIIKKNGGASLWLKKI
jgi:predicted O-methyltransferase YrrM